jgi:hypothetical protein
MNAAETAGSGNRVLQPFETDNPYLLKLFAHRAFRVFPPGTPELLAGLDTVADGEQLIAGVRVSRGLMEKGTLMVTTHWIRYASKGRRAKDGFWELDGSLAIKTDLGYPPGFRVGGNMFGGSRVPMAGRKEATDFGEIYSLVVGAGDHIRQELHTAALEGMADSGTGGTVSEIKELVALRDAGELSPEEFEVAKARLLSGS